MLAVAAIYAGLMGLLVGSFLNVVIHRVPRGESIVRPRSACGACGTPILPRDNVPIVSWLLLRARCRSCGAPISARYPFVEGVTGIAFAAVTAVVGFDVSLPAHLVLISVLIAVSAIDLEHRRIPTRIVYPALVAIAVYLICVAAVTGRWGPLAGAGVGLLVGRIPLWLANLLSPRGMGFGDVRLATLIGFTLGHDGVGLVAVALFVSFCLASVVGIALITVTERTRKDHLPFGPFLAAGALVALAIGAPIVDWYGGAAW